MHVWSQGFRNNYRSVGLLVVLEDRDPRATNREAGAIERVHKLRLRTTTTPETNLRAPRLERLIIRTRRDLTKRILRRQPHLDVVSLCRSKPDIASRERHDPIMQSQLLQDSLRVSR